MKKIIVLILCIAAMSVSVSAQGYFPKHHLPARGYADPYSHSWSSGRSGVKRFCEPQRGRGYRPPRESKIGKAAYVASEILRGIVIADRIFAPLGSMSPTNNTSPFASSSRKNSAATGDMPLFMPLCVSLKLLSTA